MKNGTKLRIQLTTEMIQEGQKETHQFDVIGEGVVKNKSLYLLYNEVHTMDDSSEVTVPVMIKITEEGKVELTRTAGQRSKLTFDLETATATQYQTPYGIMVLEVATSEIVHQSVLGEMDGQLNVQYQLRAEQGILGDYTLDLNYEEITD